MIDLRWLREQPEAFDRALARRGQPPAAAAILELDAGRRAIETRLQEDQATRNRLSREIGQADGARRAALARAAGRDDGAEGAGETGRGRAARAPGPARRAAADLPERPRRRRPGRSGRGQQRRAAALGQSAQFRVRPAPARGGRRRSRHGLRPRRAAVRRPFRGAVGPARRARARARPVHARPADPRARLHARSRCPTLSAPTRCSAPASCPRWRRISSERLPATT